MWRFAHIASPSTSCFVQGHGGKSYSVRLLTAFHRHSHCGLLHKLRLIVVGGEFLSIVSKFFSDRRQHVRLDGKISASAEMASGVSQGRILEPLLFILHTTELFHIVGNRIVGYADDITI